MMQKENIITLLGIILVTALIIIAAVALFAPFIAWGLGIIGFKTFVALALLWIYTWVLL